jgi:hypothetical protein
MLSGPNGDRSVMMGGMSLRDAFAIGALPFLAGVRGVAVFDENGRILHPEQNAQEAYKMADALLAERDKP